MKNIVKNKFVQILLLLMVGAVMVFGQQPLTFRVVNFTRDAFDMTAKNERFKKVDGSGFLYAIIKVSTSNPGSLREYNFNFGNMNHIVEEHDGELWVYVQKNAKIVTISRKGYITINKYDLHTTIESGCTYVMQLSEQAPIVHYSILQFSVSPINVSAVVKVKREGDDNDYQLWGTVDATGGIARRLETGTYLYEVVAEYYDRTEGRITLKAEEDKYIENVSLIPNFGTLVVEDKYGIAGAEIYVNDRKIGTIPYTSPEPWPVGDNYRIVVSKGDMYKTYSGTFSIRKGETTRISPQLEADFAQISITADGNAEIWVENEHKGTGTWTGNLRAGVYQVECRLDRHRPTKRTVNVVANQSQTIAMDAPIPIAGSIYINSVPLGANIRVDDKDYGTTPKEIKDILIGQHTITLTLSDYERTKSSVDVEEGKTTEVNLSLKKRINVITPKVGTTTVGNDTIEGRTFAYLLGYINTQGLKPYLVQQKSVDTTYMAQFIEGFAVKELTPKEKAVQARIAGIETRKDVETRIVPKFSSQLNDSGKVLSNEDFITGFADALRGTPLSISQDSARNAVDRFFKEKTNTDKYAIDGRTFAYLLGYINTQGLKPYLVQQKGVDTTYMAQFIEGFSVKELTPEDKAFQARIVGTEIRQDVENRILPNFSRQLSDSVKVLSDEDFVRGFSDALRGEALPISQDSAKQAIDKQFKYWRGVMMEQKYGANRKAGEDFLAANAKKDSVVTTASGLQYKVLTQGTGEKPTATDSVKVNYEGRLIDGTVFDSSYKRGKPATFGVSQVIKGWTEALMLMPVGSKWELYIPQQLAYGDHEQNQKIPPFSAMIFTVELLEIVK